MAFNLDPRFRAPLVGGAVALIAGAGGAYLLASKGRGEKPPPPPASQAGLIVEAAPADERLDAARPLRCFVAGAFVGEMTLLQCAQRNGVATDALDVGVDETGALAASDQAGTVLTPLPPPDAQATADSSAGAAGQPAAAPVGACWRYAAGWQRLPAEVTLNACVQSLFAGRCERPGSATYGRWGQQTLRLVPGKVEISGDNRSFRTLVDQGAGCAIAPVG